MDTRVFTSTYHDTPDRRFAKAGIALRRRVENGRSVWEVELPEAPGQVALSAPGGPTGPPQLVADLLRGLLRDRELEEVTTVRARREENGGEAVHDEVAVLENNWVVDEFVAEGEPQDPGLQVLEHPSGAPQPPEDATPLAHLQAMLRRQYEEILAHDPGTRLGVEPEALHKLRVAVRRSRSILRVARPMLDREATDGLRSELRWLGSALGHVRDLDVLLLHLRDEAASLPAADAAGGARVLEALEAERETARVELLEAMESSRYLDLLGRLEFAAEAPPWNGRRRSLKKLAAKEYEKLERAVRALGDEPTDEALHRARVRAKRARYAAELAEAAVGKPAQRVVARAKHFQDVVGEHQDAVVAEERLRRFADSGGASAFAAGRLAEVQQQRRTRARRAVPGAWKGLRRAGRKAWR